MGGDNHTRDLIPEAGMEQSLHGISYYSSKVGIKLRLKLCASCCSQQLFEYLHLAKHTVRMRKCTARKYCQHKHTHTHPVTVECHRGGCAAGPQQTSGFTVELRAFSLQPLSAVQERHRPDSRCAGADGCLSVWPWTLRQMDVMVDLRLNCSSADWINNAGSGLWM